MNKQQAIQKAKILKALIELSKASKILTTFIPAFKKAILKKDGTAYLHGSFNLGGTVSGRMSSSQPNIQQLPSTGSIYSKPIKKCFSAPPGYLMVGADFSSLEDKIDALLTKDTNKLKVYLDGFDGHCLRAAYYFRDQLLHIDLDSPESVNTISETHKKLRQASKAPSFALTYAGTFHTLINNCGFSEEEAKSIEARYHELYKESDIYKQKRLEQAAKEGYAEVAFGLRVRTPLLKQVLWGSENVPYEAQAEARTVGNAMGQSYCQLTNRAANAFMDRVSESDYREDIHPIAMIHDAIYLLIKDDPKILRWVNQHLIECMEWQHLPEIKHDEVKLGAELCIYYPTWADETSVPNRASWSYIKEIWDEVHTREL